MKKNSDWFLDIRETASQGEPIKTALQVSKVADGSPAAGLNLRPGDFLLSVNGQAALTANIVDILLKGGLVTYAFYQPNKQKTLTVKTQALPLGMRTEATSDGIVAQYKKSKNLTDSEGLMILWEREDYGHLRQVVETAKGSGFIGKLLAKGKANPLTDLITAVCDIETGDKAKGYAAVDAFAKDHQRKFPSDISALVAFYQAQPMLSLENQGLQQFKNKMWSAMDVYQDSDRMARVADEYEVNYIKKGRRLGTKDTYPRVMRCLEGEAETISVPGAVKALNAGQIQPICFMLTYRGNGPYNSDMKTYQTVYPFIKDRMAPMLVITSVEEKRKDRPNWFAAEEALIKAGIPITVAHEPTALFADGVLSGAPEFIALDHKGVVIWDFPLSDDYDYWNMLNRA